MKRVSILVSGTVQGVCFRSYTCERAGTLNVMGYVRNLPDGRVEILAEGEDSAVDQLILWAGHGPSYADVTGTEVEILEFRGDISGFHVSY